MDAWIAGLIFVVTYAIIATDRFGKTLAALLGGLLMVLLRVLDQTEAFAAIDFNVIFLLAGMMVLASILGRTGFFQWIAIKAVKLAGGDPIRILAVLGLVCGVLSAFLPNVTTVVLVAPVTLYIAVALGVSPLPFLITEVLAANIGGTATLIGDPPNLIIGSAAGFDFVDFLINLTPAVVAIFGAFLLTVGWLFRNDLRVHAEAREAVLALDENEVITDHRSLRVALAVIGVTLLGFLVQGPLGYEAATVALLGATVLMLLVRLEPETVLREVDWSTLLFFVGLFILVGGIVNAGIVAALGEGLFKATGGNQTVATLGLLWLSGLASGIVDNIPYATTMIPVVHQLERAGLSAEPLWWSLALGADLGGNATVIGAGANVVVATLAARAGHPIGFRQFLRYGVVIVLESLIISSAYVWLRYLL